MFCNAAHVVFKVPWTGSETVHMKLILLGTSGYHPADERQTTCLMLPEVGIVLDAGTGLYRAADCIATDELDVYLSHAHLDHVVGLTYLTALIARCGLKRITVHGEPQTLQAVEEHLFSPALFPLRPPFQMQSLRRNDAITPLPRNGSLRHFQLIHPGGAIGYRLEWPGHSLAYVTDTTASEEAPYLESILGVGLLVHECYFWDDSDRAAATGHSCLGDVALLAARAGAGRLLLIHLNPTDPICEGPRLDQARSVFEPIEVAQDRLSVAF
jgi:ribonuclease BN (tRNA processing enzyme)